MSKELDYIKHFSTRLEAVCSSIGSVSVEDKRQDRATKVGSAIQDLFTASNFFVMARLGPGFRVNGQSASRMISENRERLASLHSLILSKEISGKRLVRYLKECSSSLSSLNERACDYLAEHEQAELESKPVVQQPAMQIQPMTLKSLSDLGAAVRQQQKAAEEAAKTVAKAKPVAEPSVQTSNLLSTNFEVRSTALIDQRHFDQVTDMVKHYEAHPLKIKKSLSGDAEYDFFRTDVYAIFERSLPVDRLKFVRIKEVYPGYIFSDQLVMLIDNDIDPYGSKYDALLDRVLPTLKAQTGKTYVDIGRSTEPNIVMRWKGVSDVYYIWLVDHRLVSATTMALTYAGFPNAIPPNRAAPKQEQKTTDKLRKMRENLEARVATELQKELEEQKIKQRVKAELENRQRQMLHNQISLKSRLNNAQESFRNMQGRPDQFNAEQIEQTQKQIEKLELELNHLENGNPHAPQKTAEFVGLIRVTEAIEQTGVRLKELKKIIDSKTEEIRREMFAKT